MKLNPEQYNAIWAKLRDLTAALKAVEAQLGEILARTQGPKQ